MLVPVEARNSALLQKSSGLKENQDERRVSAVLSHLAEQDLAQVSSMKAIAESLNISASRLRRIFKQKTGIPFGKYVKTTRLRKARQLLQETSLSVKQVRIEVGLYDHSHFARDYKKQFGESPTGTRRTRTHAKTVAISDAPMNVHFHPLKSQSTMAG